MLSCREEQVEGSHGPAEDFTCFFVIFLIFFALGVLMWEVFSEGKIPYENRTNGEVVEEINAGFRLYKPKLASKAIYEVMSHCWRMVSIVTGEPSFPKTRPLSPLAFRRRERYILHMLTQDKILEVKHCVAFVCASKQTRGSLPFI